MHASQTQWIYDIIELKHVIDLFAYTTPAQCMDFKKQANQELIP